MTATPLLINAEGLRFPVADDSVHCAVCSPPYWGLRVYKGAQSRIWGGDSACEHEWDEVTVKFYKHEEPHKYAEADDEKPDLVKSAYCTKCGAWLGALGLEPTVDQYVANMVQIGEEVKRILHPSGTWWLNIGDCYSGSGGAGGDYNVGGLKDGQPRYPGRNVENLKPKDLVGVPWRLAFALQDAGWWLRKDIVWYKPNAMPESVTDRPTSAHEYMFLLSKSHKYYYDADAIAEPAIYAGDTRGARTDARRGTSMKSVSGTTPKMRNKRDVWIINTRPYGGAHFAAYPPDLVEPCVKAGSSEYGVCSNCGAPWERNKQAVSKPDRSTQEKREYMIEAVPGRETASRMNTKNMEAIVYEQLGWLPTCDCVWDCPDKDQPQHWQTPCPICSENLPYPIVAAKVFDPFIGTGTTLQVARALGRVGVGVDLSLAYLQQARKRLMFDKMDEWEQGKKDNDSDLSDLPMFGGENDNEIGDIP